MYLILKKTLICWKTEFTIVYGKIEMQKKGSKNAEQELAKGLQKYTTGALLLCANRAPTR